MTDTSLQSDISGLLNNADALRQLRRQHKALEGEGHTLRERVLDLEDSLARVEAQHEVLENFCFGLEKEHERHKAILVELKSEQDDILAHVKQGILTLNVDGTINAEYSAASERIFGRTKLAGVRFVELFADPTLKQRVERLIDVLFNNPWMDTSLLARLNPLRSLHCTTEAGAHRVLDCAFLRIFKSHKSGEHARIAKVMVVIDDQTVEYELSKELERRTREQAQKIEQVYQILMLPPSVFAEFASEAEMLLGQVWKRIMAPDFLDRSKGLLRDCMRDVHTLKGSARAMGLDAVAEAAHHFEDALERALASESDASCDTTRRELKQHYESVQRVLHEGSSFLERVVRLRDEMATRNQTWCADLERPLRKLVEAESSAAGKAVEFSFQCSVPHMPPTKVMARMKNACVQLIRNAIAHGIEAAAEREKVGKPSAGRIELRIGESDQVMEVTCRDDGAGIDIDALKRKVVAKGLMVEESVALLNEEAAMELIFMPGLSTADATTQLAGRGVGMDIVRSALREIDGTVRVTSRRGQFTEFVITIPREQVS